MLVQNRADSNALIAAQKRSLELVVSGAPLEDVLCHLVRTVEEEAAGQAVAAIMLLDGDNRLRNAAAPGLPDDYLRAIDGLSADAGVGTCCAAAALGDPVITPDFAASPGWNGLAHLPLGIGLRGAWSMPILARDGSVLGTFGTYFRECREPTAVEREVVEVLARTASIAIERDRSEAALQEQLAFNRRLLASSADCITVLDLDGRMLSINEAGRRLMRLTESEVVGLDYTTFWRRDDRDAALAAIERARAGGEGRFEAYAPTPAGEPQWWDVLITPIVDGTGAPYRLLVVSRDVSERHLAQQELELAKEEAELASQAKSQFLAVMSHELRTPLSGIIGYADLLVREVGGPVSETQSSHLARIKAAAWHLVSIIDEILTFSRVEAGKEEVTLSAVDVAQIARESVDLLGPQAAAKGLELRVIAPDSLVIRSEAGKLRQIVLNLAGNALKFTDQGVVELTVEPQNDTVLLSVRDTGPGIPAGQLGRIFEPFVQLDQANTRTRGGTGLGLAVSRRLARMLGGDLEVARSVVGDGSTFVLRLPVAAGQSASTPGARDPVAAAMS